MKNNHFVAAAESITSGNGWMGEWMDGGIDALRVDRAAGSRRAVRVSVCARVCVYIHTQL